MVAIHIEDAVGHGDVAGIGTEVVIQHRSGPQAPDSARILEVADQLLLLRVDTDDGQGSLRESPPLSLNALELAVAVWMWLGERLEVGVEAIAQLVEEPANRAGADVDVPPHKFAGDLSQAFIGPHSATTHRITRRVLLEQTGQDPQEFGRFFPPWAGPLRSDGRAWPELDSRSTRAVPVPLCLH